MSKALGNIWIVIVVSAAMLLVVAVACSAETVEVPGETVVVEKEVVKEVMGPGRDRRPRGRQRGNGPRARQS